jgi:hypothetical protein
MRLGVRYIHNQLQRNRVIDLLEVTTICLFVITVLAVIPPNVCHKSHQSLITTCNTLGEGNDHVQSQFHKTCYHNVFR